MSNLLEDVNELLNQNKGDHGRLQNIKKTLESKRILYISDSKYLRKLTKEFLEDYEGKRLPKINSYDYPEYVNKLKEKPVEQIPKDKIKERLRYSDKSDDMLYSENEQMIGNNEPDSNVQNKQENKIFCTNCGNQMLESAQFCTNCGKSPNGILQANIPSHQQHPSTSTKSASGIWYLLPIFLGWFGGIIAWAVIRNRNSKRAKNCLIIGVIVTIVPMIVFYLVLPSASLFSGTSEIDDILSEFPERIQDIKLGQILNCENNMGYLQSFELGEMLKDRCINGILGK